MAYDTTVFIPLDPYAVFDLVTQPERLRRWKTVAARVDLVVGGEYRWTITPGHSAAGHVRELIPGKKMVISWGWEGDTDLPPDASVVTITLEAVTGGTNLRLNHDGLNEEQAASHGEGWSHYLARLAEYATNGEIAEDPWKYAPANMDELTAAEAALVIAQRVLNNISIGDFEKPTPCEDMNVGQLVDHLYRAINNYAKGLGAVVEDDKSRSAEDRVATIGQVAIEAFRKAGLAGTIDLTFATFPKSLAICFLDVEILVHTWDLATATGQLLDVSPVVSNFIYELAEKSITDGVRGTGLYGPVVSTDTAAASLDRLIAFTGRQPVAS
ncbi:MAG: TIGR03086 family metal-binding protein [Actinomycetes bacterium]